MKIKNIICTVACLLPLLSHALEMDPKEKDRLEKGELIKDIKAQEKLVWPMVTIRALIPGTPEQNMKGFTQFDKHPTFIPDLLVSKVVKTISPTQMHVYAEMKVPWPVKKSVYTTNNVITSGKDGTKKLKWNKVDGDLIKATDGHLSFTPYEGKSLMEYRSQIVPDSKFAGMFKDQVPKDVEKSVVAIVKFLAQEQSQSAAK